MEKKKGLKALLDQQVGNLPVERGGRVVRWCWVHFQCYNLDYSRTRAYCTCSRCGWGLFAHFYSHLSFLSSFSLSLGDGPILTEILSQRAVKQKATNQPTNSQLP